MDSFGGLQHKMICSKGDFTALYHTAQINGQLVTILKFEHPPKRGTEIFLKNIPRDALLQDILEFVIHCGVVYQIRLLMDFSGFNRGYCFVTYADPYAARKAVITLNGEQIRSSPVVVKLSFDNNKLEMRGLPPDITRQGILKKVSQIIGNGLQEVITFKDISKKHICVLKYDTHRNALEARKKVWPRIFLWKRPIEIDWAMPHEIRNSKKLYFDTVPFGTTKLQLYDEVTKYINAEMLLNMFLNGRYGYFLFTSYTAACEAYDILRTAIICGKVLQYSFCKFFIGNGISGHRSNLVVIN